MENQGNRSLCREASYLRARSRRVQRLTDRVPLVLVQIAFSRLYEGHFARKHYRKVRGSSVRGSLHRMKSRESGIVKVLKYLKTTHLFGTVTVAPFPCLETLFKTILSSRY